MAEAKRKRKPLTPEQKQRKAEYDKKYIRDNCKKICVTISPADMELYDVWRSIPAKREWLLSCLRTYQQEHNSH